MTIANGVGRDRYPQLRIEEVDSVVAEGSTAVVATGLETVVKVTRIEENVWDSDRNFSHENLRLPPLQKRQATGEAP